MTFVRKTRAKNVDEIDTLCFLLEDFLPPFSTFSKKRYAYVGFLRARIQSLSKYFLVFLVFSRERRTSTRTHSKAGTTRPRTCKCKRTGERETVVVLHVQEKTRKERQKTVSLHTLGEKWGRGVGVRDIRTKNSGNKKWIVFCFICYARKHAYRKMVGKSRSITKAWPCEA